MKRLIFLLTSENKLLGFQSIKRSTEREANHPGFETWNPGACLAVLGMHWSLSVWIVMDALTSLCNSHFFSVCNNRERRRGPSGASWSLAAFLLMTHRAPAMLYMPCSHLRWSQAALPDKGSKQCSEFSCCHCLTVGLFLTELLTIIPSLLKKCWKVVTFSQKFLAGIIPMPAAKHQTPPYSAHPCPWGCSQLFNSDVEKLFSFFFYFPLRLLETWSGFQKATAVIEVTN